jgi:hypothetical protein
MSTEARDSAAEKVRELAEEYARAGYSVSVEPDPARVPFDVGGYRPDLLVEKGGEHYIIEVKASGRRASVDRYARIAEEAARHEGWRFLLVTPDDVQPAAGPLEGRLVPIDQLRSQAAAAAELYRLGQPSAALLALWVVFEGLLRHRARQASLPVERMPTSVMMKHLYSHGELSMEQYDVAREAYETRNRVAHAFEAPDASEAYRSLQRVVSELLDEWCG